jgi:hypothetical protein
MTPTTPDLTTLLDLTKRTVTADGERHTVEISRLVVDLGSGRSTRR